VVETVSARLLPRPHTLLAGILLVVVTCLVYAPGLNGGYAFDDFPNIVDNVALHVDSLNPDAWIAALFSSPSSDLRRPIAMATFAINTYFTGLDPMAMKATNIAIHAINALLVAGLAGAVLRWLAARGRPVPHPRATAWSIAAAWALHPINVMAVLFIVQRMESLSHTFVFAGLWLYIDGRLRQLQGRPGALRMLVGMLGFAAIGALVKESAVLLPLYALCLELCIGGFRGTDDRFDRRLPRLYVAVLLVPALAAVAILLPRSLAPDAFMFRPFTLGERLLTEGRVVLQYFHWSVLPDPRAMSLYHDDLRISHAWMDPPSTLAALLALSALLGAAFALRRRRPLTALGLLWFFAAQVLTATFLPLELMYEHRNYFASLGVCFVLADLLLVAPASSGMRVGGRALVVLFVAWCGTAAAMRAHEWNHPLRFAQTEAYKRPASPRATYALGRILTIESRYRPDSPYLRPARDAMERARRVPGSGIMPVAGLLLIAANTGQPQNPDWWHELEDKLASHPIGPEERNALQSLARCRQAHACAIPPERMEGAFRAALANEPNVDVMTMYASHLWYERRPREAEPLFREAVSRQPTTAQYRINLARFLIANGRSKEARKEIEMLREQDVVGENRTAIAELEAAAR
jgi:protein O-mannosyl-transferase